MKWRGHVYRNRDPVLEEVVNDQAVEVYDRVWGRFPLGVPSAFFTWRHNQTILFLRGWSPLTRSLTRS